MTNGDWIALAGAIAASLAVVIALIAMIWQARLTYRSTSVDNMWRFLDVWNGPEMRQCRIKACESLRSNGTAGEITDLLGFFEELGFLVQQHSLDANSAWAMFSDWAIPYRMAADYYIKNDQREDPTSWDGFEYLYHRLLQIEAKRRNKAIQEVMPTAADIARLLESESHLA
jgi:hypothetical protein